MYWTFVIGHWLVIKEVVTTINVDFKKVIAWPISFKMETWMFGFKLICGFQLYMGPLMIHTFLYQNLQSVFNFITCCILHNLLIGCHEIDVDKIVNML
jgi:hypothetical protein